MAGAPVSVQLSASSTDQNGALAAPNQPADPRPSDHPGRATGRRHGIPQQLTYIWETAPLMSQISRRALFGRRLLVLSAGVGAGLGLQHRVHHRVAVPPPAPPAALTAALDRQRTLLAGYDQITDDQLPARTGLRADLQAHGDALRALLELYPGWRLAQASPSVQPSAGATP